MRRYASLAALLLLLILFPVYAQDEQLVGSGTVTGHITDEKNQPVGGANVRVVRLDSRDRKIQEQSMPDTSSDATGRYEFQNVPAGDYLVSVQFTAAGLPEAGKVKNYFYPGVLSSSDARILRVGPNAVLTAIDIQCAPGTQGFLARGRVIDAVSRKPVGNMQLVYGLDFSNPHDFRISLDAHTDIDGSFILRDLNPGKYWLGIYHASSKDYYCIPLYFEISDNDVTGLEIPVKRGVSLSGTVLLDEGIPDTLFHNTYVSFYPSGISAVNQHALNGLVDQYMRKMSPISSKGLFTISGVPPITGTLSLQDSSGQSLSDYVIQIQQNEKILSKVMRVQESDIADIFITVTAGKGAIEGMVHSTGGILDLDRVQVLISLNNDKTVFFSKKVGLNAKGEFKIEGLVPGEYNMMVIVTSPDGKVSWRTGPVRQVNIQNGVLSTIDLPVPGEHNN